MRPKSREGFEIAIICALPEEADVVKALFDEPYEDLCEIYGKQSGDANTYTSGRIGQHSVVLCYMPRMGKGSAASVASSLLVSYTGIKLALVVGICGGVPFPSKNTAIILGDVIISDSIVEYDFGRQYGDGFRRKNDTIGPVNREIGTFLAGLKTRNMRSKIQERAAQYIEYLQKQTGSEWNYPGTMKDVLFETSYRHKHYRQPVVVNHVYTGYECSTDHACEAALKSTCKEPGCLWKIRHDRLNADSPNPVVHIGTIASADTVMKSGEHRDQLAEKDEIIGFEMEGAGVRHNIPCVIIKGVCDYADSYKNKIWQNYAAATAACCAKVFLEYWIPTTKVIARKPPLLTEPSSDLKDLKGSIDDISAQSRVGAIFVWLVFLYCRELLMTIHTRLTRVINPWSELPAYLEDAHLRRFTIPLDTIDSWEVFDFILEHHFRNMPGHQKVKMGSYLLKDSITRKELKHTNAFKACFRPGRRILMSMLFRHTQHEESSCPSCHAINVDSGLSDVCCSSCGMQYRRITEVLEDDEERPSTRSNNAVRTETNPIGSRLFSGPETSAEVDPEGEDIAEFKRVQIVDPPNSTQRLLDYYCRRAKMNPPVFNIISDRRGGRTAWTCSVKVGGMVHAARYWYDVAYLVNAREDAAEVAINNFQMLRTDQRQPNRGAMSNTKG